MERPALNRSLDAATFRNHYYLKEELVRFCRASGLPATGGKAELTERIACFLEGKPVERVKVTKVRTKLAGTLSEETLIESPCVCSEIHRAFFKAKIGSSFSFNVAFQKWLKSNAGKRMAMRLKPMPGFGMRKKRNKLRSIRNLNTIPISALSLPGIRAVA